MRLIKPALSARINLIRPCANFVILLLGAAAAAAVARD